MMLEVQGIDAAYGNVQVLKDLSLRVQAGEILCLLGRNGAGKTTILKAIMGLVRAQKATCGLRAKICIFCPHTRSRATGSDTYRKGGDCLPK